jgi:hypothetical protein
MCYYIIRKIRFIMKYIWQSLYILLSWKAFKILEAIGGEYKWDTKSCGPLRKMLIKQYLCQQNNYMIEEKFEKLTKYLKCANYILLEEDGRICLTDKSKKILEKYHEFKLLNCWQQFILIIKENLVPLISVFAFLLSFIGLIVSIHK